MPKGGRHAQNPILCEDQLGCQGLKAKRQVKYDALSPDYTQYASPFAPTDIGSRAALQRNAAKAGVGGGVGRGRRNPNANSKVYGRRK